MHGAESFERVDEKRAGAAGGVEHAQLMQRRGGVRGENERCVGIVEGIGGQVGECMAERVAYDVLHERGWRVERAGASAFVGGHERLKGASQHFRVNRGL